MSYQQAIEWLFGTQQFGIKLGLDGPRRLLKEALAHPAHGVKVIHVAGTNGKGSTCAMIDRVARSCGWRSGLFTSPHLIDYRERMRVSGEMISEDRCAELLTELRDICETLDPHPTFFEITLAVAMKWFGERHCDLIVLETGMGGRLDATTAVPADVCVITPIGLDHTQWLGSTLAAIAREKAGIFLEGKPAISAPQEPEAAQVLEKEANERRSPLTFITEPLSGYGITLPGVHQRWNAGLALAALHKAGVAMAYEAVADGLGKVSWPGRFEAMESEGSILVLDGAHNPHAAATLAATWREQFGETRCTLIFGAVESKDISGIWAELAGLTGRVIFCKVGTARGLEPCALLAQIDEAERESIECFPDFQQALAAAKTSPAPILIAGSLFLVGEARAAIIGGGFQSSEQ